MAKREREPVDTREGPRSFARFFEQVADGDFHRDASKRLFELSNALRDEAIRVDGKVKGKMTIVVDVSVDERGQVGFNCDSAIKIPKPKRTTAQAWITASGNLTLEHPTQIKLPLREVGGRESDIDVNDERGNAREV